MPGELRVCGMALCMFFSATSDMGKAVRQAMALKKFYRNKWVAERKSEASGNFCGNFNT